MYKWLSSVPRHMLKTISVNAIRRQWISLNMYDLTIKANRGIYGTEFLTKEQFKNIKDKEKN